MASRTNVEVATTTPYWNLNEEEEEEASSLAWSLLCDGLKFGVLKAVIELDILEIIKKCGPGAQLSAVEIVAKLPTENPDAANMVRRMLDCLASHSFLTVSHVVGHDETVERRYGLAPVCRFFTKNEEGISLAHFVNTAMTKTLFDSCLHIKDAVLEGGTPFTRAYGMTLYEYSGKHNEHQQGFDKAMSDNSTLFLRKLLRNCKIFEGISCLVDVGGGNGATLSMILSQCPKIKGINFDQPHVVANAPSYHGVEHVGGNMFDQIPKGDAIFLKWICHCFNDESCIRILKNCYTALPDDHGKVIICEFLLPNANDTSTNIVGNSVFHFDISMMVITGGKERSQDDFKALALASGFYSCQVVGSAYNVKVMELRKKKLADQ